MSEIILCIDPGDTTGYCIARVSKEEIAIVEFGEKVYPVGAKMLLTLGASAAKIIIEDFTIRKPLIGSKGTSLRIIGAFQLSSLSSRVVMQQPAEKWRCDDKMLKSMKLWLKSSSPHVRDAFRHAVIYAQKKHNFRFKTAP
jgi:hypothetical protein